MTPDEQELQNQIHKQMRDWNRGDMAGWAECQREIERLVTLIPSPSP